MPEENKPIPSSHLPADIDLAKKIQEDLKKSAEQVEANRIERIRMSPKGFTLPDDTTGDTICCVIVDFVSSNTHYAGDFDANNPIPPDCYATGRNPNELTPSSSVEKPYHPTCTGCPKNEFGSAKQGAGKACKNTRRLAVMQEGASQDSGLWELSIPPSSIRYFDTYITTTCRGRAGLPCQAVLTKIYMDDKKTYAAPRFQLIRPLDDDELAFYYSRKGEAEAILLG